MPAGLRAALGPDEHILAAGRGRDDVILAASRFGLWLVEGEAVRRVDWHLISKARLTRDVLHLVIADEVTTWPDGTVVLVDRGEASFPLAHPTKVTDMVHQRVSSSVTASRHVPWPGAGGWVVLRKVAGRDGLTVQVRLDPGSDSRVEGFADAVADAAVDLWPAGTPHPGDVNEVS